MVCMKQKSLQMNKLKNKKWLKKKLFNYDNLSKDKLNTKSDKQVYVRNDNMTFVIRHCRGERKIDEFRKKLIIPESKILECSECDVKSKIGIIFVNEKILGKYSVKSYEIDL